MSGTAGVSRRWARVELGIAVLAAVASVVILCYAARNTWFRQDVWDFLVGRPAGSLESWVRPHAGHLQWVTVGLHRALYGLVGLDFWPWYYLPHAVGYAGLMFLLWRILLRRGADRLVAFAAFLVMLVLGVSYYLSSIAVGGLIVAALLLVVAERFDAERRPSWREGVLVSSALTLMITTSSLGAAALLACFIALALTRALRHWWWCFPVPLALYGVWYAAYGGRGPGKIDWGHWPQAPADVAYLFGTAIGKLAGFDGSALLAGVMVTATLAAGLAWLAWRRRLRRWDLILLGTLAGYLLMVILVRGAAGSVPLELPRYSFPIILLCVPLIVPHLRVWQGRGRAAVTAGVVVVAAYLVVHNGWQRIEGTNGLEQMTLRGRVAIENVAQLLAAGEPAIDDVHLKTDLGIGSAAGVLRVSDVRGLLSDGWVPDPRASWGRLEAARSRLRFHVAEGGAAGPPPLAVPEGGDGGCVSVDAAGRLLATVMRGGVFSLAPMNRERPAVVALTWEDAFGAFPTEVTVADVQSVTVAEPPAGGAVLALANLGTTGVRVCGIEAASGD